MKKFNKYSLITALAVAFALGLTGTMPVMAATSPSLGAADTYGVLAGTYTNTVAGTTINGDVGYTTGPATVPTVNGTIYGPGAPTPQARIDAAAALATLATNPCTENLGVIVNLSTVGSHPTGVYNPGVYCSTGAMSIGTAGITLSGAGTYIFRAVGALTSVANSVVTLANGASSCDVFWTPTAATTLAANTTFVGTIIDNANAITVGANTAWTGRALSLGAGTVTTDTNTITRACSTASPFASGGSNLGTITVIKNVINDNGRTKVIADFPLFINDIQVSTNITPITSGIIYTFYAPATYRVTETNDANYTRTFSGDCDSNGQVGINSSDNKVCIVTNNDIGAPVVAPVPPLIDVVKVPSPLALPAGPGPVTYTYTLRNIGTVPVTNITMVGDTCSPIVLVSGDTNGDAKLQVSETWVHTCTTTLTATHTNVVVATGWANGISAVDFASATVVVGLPVVPPLIHVTKTPSSLALSAGGGMVTYTKKITNPGTVTLTNVNLTDDKCSPMVYISGDTNANSQLETTETWTYTCRTNLTQTTTNTAIATGQANGMTARDFAIATVVVAAPKLPNTGAAPLEANALWSIIVLAGIFAASIFFYFARRKQIV